MSSHSFGLCLLLTLLFFVQNSFGQTKIHKIVNNETHMNGYSLEEFKDFLQNWRMVTVRYRKDTNEMRITFANELAWKTLESGATDYPDGAVFAKVGIVSSEDPYFVSSMVPRGARRYQFMVKNQAVHQETGGWGFALFDVDGKTFPEDLPSASRACFACHTVVEDRGYVFSQPFQLAPGAHHFFPAESKSFDKPFQKIQFKSQEVKKLSAEIRKALGDKWKKIQVLDDDRINAHIFQGTLDEIKPTLERESFTTKLPAALISADGKRFSIIHPISQEGCKETRAFRSLMTYQEGGEKPTQVVRSFDYCNP